MSKLGRYGNYPRKPAFEDTPTLPPKIRKAVIKENTVRNRKGETEIIGNAPNVNYLKKKYYGI
jgi:hypothetical protein